MTKHSKHEREQRALQKDRVAEIQEAWSKSVPAETAKTFALSVAAARARGPEPKAADMAPGTMPNPPRPGREPKPKKEPARPRRGGG